VLIKLNSYETPLTTL